MIEGKLANRVSNQFVKLSDKTTCGKCSRLFPVPKEIIVQGEGKNFYCKSYVGTSYFVYETQGGKAICYCSQKCAKKHNHRFRGNR